MEMHAYPEIYVSGAMMTMGTMLDYAVNYRNENIDYFFQAFINMGFAMQFEIGNPDVIAGKSGVELYRMIKCDYHTQMPQYVSFTRSPEYWLGWSLAYYQWYTRRGFREITEVIRPSEMLQWYPTLHEADRMRFVDAVEERFLQVNNRQAYPGWNGSSQIQPFNPGGFQGYTAMNQMGTSALPQPVIPAYGAFQMQLMRNIEENNRRIAQLQAEQQRIEAERNKYRYGYISQFPYQNMSVQDNRYWVPKQPFLDNWNQYWQPTAQTETQGKQLERVAKEFVSNALRQSGNPNASMMFDGYCMITADNLLDAVASALKIIDTATRNN